MADYEVKISGLSSDRRLFKAFVDEIVGEYEDVGKSGNSIEGDMELSLDNDKHFDKEVLL